MCIIRVTHDKVHLVLFCETSHTSSIISYSIALDKIFNLTLKHRGKSGKLCSILVALARDGEHSTRKQHVSICLFGKEYKFISKKEQILLLFFFACSALACSL